MTPPSAQSIAATTEVLELASLLDNRVAAPDKARIAAWANQIDRHQLDRDDLLGAVQDFYDRPSPQPISVGDVIDGARRLKRDHLDRIDRPAIDHKAADETRALVAAMPLGPTANPTTHMQAAERALQCCTTKAEAQQAIRQYFAAKTEARKVQT